MKRAKKLLCALLAGAMLFAMAACGQENAEPTGSASAPQTTPTPSQTAEEPFSSAKDGTYTDFGSGRNDFIYVETTFENGRITSVEVTDEKETPTIAAPALNMIPDRIVENQSVNIDTIATCTLACNGIIEAVKGCIEQAGASVDEFMTDATSKPESTGDATYDCDVAIVGAGGSGLAAAVRAAQLGLNVVMMEKRNVTGGALYGTECHYSLNSIGDVMFDMQTQTPEEGYEYHMNHNHNNSNPEIVKLFMNNVGTSTNWIISLGNNVEAAYDSFRGPNTSTWLMLEGEGPGVAVRLQGQCNELGVTTLLNTTGKSLIMDENGQCVGVNAETAAGDKVTVNAKSVIVATGGFVDNEEMLAEYVGQNQADASTSGGNLKAGGTGGRMGEGIQMCWDVGAAKFGQEWVAYSLTTVPGCAIDSPVHRVGYQGYLWVNNSGERFSNESGGFMLACDQEHGFYWSILDQSMIDFMSTNNTLAGTCFTPSTNAPIEGLQEILDAAVEKGFVLKADTLEDLAAQMEVPAETFVSTVETYNTYCANGEDPDFGKAAESLIAFGEGPYYAVKMVGGMLTTIGGVKINEKMEVISEDGDVIPGLYCIGADAGGFYAEHYNFLDSGCASSFSFLSGKTAAESITEALTGEKVSDEWADHDASMQAVADIIGYDLNQ